jgi:hypothetical protein
MKVATSLGELDDSELEKSVDVLDTPEKYALRVTYRLRGMDVEEMGHQFSRWAKRATDGDVIGALRDWEPRFAEAVSRETQKHEAGVVAVYELPVFAKVNPFEADPPSGTVTTDFQDGNGFLEMPVSLLDKKLIVTDNENEYTCRVEYRVKGSGDEGKVVHASVDVKLKKSTVTGTAIAAQL